MTKRLISTIVLAGMILGSVDAFASRARENVMGRGDAGSVLNSTGSMYYDSMYNIFYNPAYVNDFKNWAIIEKGPGNATTAGNQAEGGFVANIMNFNVGVFFNREDAYNLPVTLPGVTNAVGVRPIDVVFGGDMGVKWGLGATYTSSEGTIVNPNTKHNSLTLRAGVSIMDFDPFISYRISGKSETTNTTPTTEDKTNDATVGLRYHYGEWTPYAAYRFGKGEDTTAGFGETGKFTSMLVGVGRNVKLGEGARMVYSIAFARINAKDLKFAANGATDARGSRKVIPIDMALEGDLSSWLTLRGGLGYRLMDKFSGPRADVVGAPVAGDTGSAADAVTARIGATIHANKFDFDWAFGTGAGAIDGQTFGFDSGTFTNASLSYKW